MKDTPISLAYVLGILAKHEAKYPLDLFPEEGTSQDCATARFARGLIHSILDEMVELAEKSGHEEARQLLADIALGKCNPADEAEKWLRAYGWPPDSFAPVEPCKFCGGSGWWTPAHNGGMVDERCRCQQAPILQAAPTAAEAEPPCCN